MMKVAVEDKLISKHRRNPLNTLTTLENVKMNITGITCKDMS